MSDIPFEQRIGELKTTLRTLFAELPADFKESQSMATQIRTAFHEELAAAIQSRLGAYTKSLPQDTYADKQMAARSLNYDLHHLGLSMLCPRTLKPAILVADIRDAQTQKSRFRFEVDGANGKSTRTITAYEIPQITLVPELPRREGGSRWNPGRPRGA